MATEQASTKLPTQEADKLRSDVNRILKQLQQQHTKQCNLNPSLMQSPNRTQKGQHQGGSYSGQGGWPWSSWTNKTTSTKPKHYFRTPTHTKFSPKTPPPSSKTNSLPFSKTLNKQEASPPKRTNNFTPPVQSPQILWPAQNTQNRHPTQTHCFQ